MSDLHEEAVKKKGSSSSRKVRYEECSKNHKASQGNYATDGCMGFMASDASLLCDACGCHRNFHKVKTVEEEEDGNSRAASEVRYTECRKNHALRMGKNSYTDGCMEFMASDGDEEVVAAGSSAALKCGACGCHRNFHRRKEEIVRKPSPPLYSGRRRAMYDSDDY